MRAAVKKLQLKIEVALRDAQEIEAHDEIDGLRAVRDIGRAVLACGGKVTFDTLLAERFLVAVGQARNKWPYLDL